MFSNNLYFLKNINTPLFLKLNIFLEKKRCFYENNLNQTLNVFINNVYLKNKIISSTSTRKNFFLSLYGFFSKIVFVSFILEIILLFL